MTIVAGDTIALATAGILEDTPDVGTVQNGVSYDSGRRTGTYAPSTIVASLEQVDGEINQR